MVDRNQEVGPRKKEYINGIGIWNMIQSWYKKTGEYPAEGYLPLCIALSNLTVVETLKGERPNKSGPGLQDSGHAELWKLTQKEVQIIAIDSNGKMGKSDYDYHSILLMESYDWNASVHLVWPRAHYGRKLSKLIDEYDEKHPVYRNRTAPPLPEDKNPHNCITAVGYFLTKLGLMPEDYEASIRNEARHHTQVGILRKLLVEHLDGMQFRYEYQLFPRMRIKVGKLSKEAQKDTKWVPVSVEDRKEIPERTDVTRGKRNRDDE